MTRRRVQPAVGAGQGAQLPGLPRGVRPYDWALAQLRVCRAHAITRGAAEVVVAVIDLGYRHHPDLEGHLWRPPGARRGAPGWDCADDDASLEYRGPGARTSAYFRGHHVFVAGEVAAMAPCCPIMIVRVAYGQPASWAGGIRWAVAHGARVLVIPHDYIAGEASTGTPRFYQGTDFAYPDDNPDLIAAMREAGERGCLIVKGTADNRGRCVASATAALSMVLAVGSANRRGEPADICASAAYVAVGAPAGQRDVPPRRGAIWGCGGDRDYVPFTGGCMASGFAGGVAALVWSRFPWLGQQQLRQVLQNTARPARGVVPDADGWDPRLGYGLLDAGRAVSLHPERLPPAVRLRAATVRVRRSAGRWRLEARLRNRGALDAERVLVVAFDGDPTRPADPRGTLAAPAAPLQTRQLGHTIARVRGLHETAIAIALVQPPPATVWLETCCLAPATPAPVHRTRVRRR